MAQGFWHVALAWTRHSSRWSKRALCIIVSRVKVHVHVMMLVHVNRNNYVYLYLVSALYRYLYLGRSWPSYRQDVALSIIHFGRSIGQRRIPKVRRNGQCCIWTIQRWKEATGYELASLGKISGAPSRTTYCLSPHLMISQPYSHIRNRWAYVFSMWTCTQVDWLPAHTWQTYHLRQRLIPLANIETQASF